MGAPKVSPAAEGDAGAVPDHCLGVPLGVGEWSGTAEADPRRGSSQAGGTTSVLAGCTVAAYVVSPVCGPCLPTVRLISPLRKVQQLAHAGWIDSRWVKIRESERFWRRTVTFVRLGTDMKRSTEIVGLWPRVAGRGCSRVKEANNICAVAYRGDLNTEWPVWQADTSNTV
jgi:hypothetical protein